MLNIVELYPYPYPCPCPPYIVHQETQLVLWSLLRQVLAHVAHIAVVEAVCCAAAIPYLEVEVVVVVVWGGVGVRVSV